MKLIRGREVDKTRDWELGKKGSEIQDKWHFSGSGNLENKFWNFFSHIPLTLCHSDDLTSSICV